MLENNGTTLKEAGQLVLNALSEYMDESRAGLTTVVNMQSIKSVSDELKLDKYIRKGGLDLKGLQVFLQSYLQNSMHMHHPAYIGHQVAVPHFASGLSDLIHGVIGNAMSIYEMGPTAAAAEQAVIRWMLEKIGWTEEGAGVLTNGGSIANLHAMLAARAHIAPDAWQAGNPNDLVVLCPENAHYCIHRAVSMMGLGSTNVLVIPTDRNEMIDPNGLQELVHSQKAEGKRIMAVVANACATSTGLYDPIEAIAKLCHAEKIWFHLDSPHGATALLSVKYRHYLKGIELADSMVWDAHKMMQTSALCTGILFRKRTHLENTFSQKATYLFHDKKNLGVDVLAHQVECTKSALGTKLFMVLASIGEKELGNFVAKLYDQSRSFAHLINQRPGFTSPFPIHSNIVCFQYQPDIYDQLALRNKLIETGKFYISSTEIKGKRYLRLTVMNLSTSKETIEHLLDQIEVIANNE